MENSYDELLRFLNDSGKLGTLRKHLLSFLLNVEGLSEVIDTPKDRDREAVGELIKNIESYLNQLAQYQQIADQMFLEMGKEKRQTLYREAPEVLKFFGWYDKIDEAGDIMRKT